ENLNARVATATAGMEGETPKEQKPKKSPTAAEPRGDTRPTIDWQAVKPQLTDDQRDILAALRDKTLLTDELIDVTQIPTRRILSALTLLQVRGYIEEQAGKRFAASVLLKE
ncbi:MAG: hypothetical protein RR450_02995, partial [Oscillospiraceae bacterium]